MLPAEGRSTISLRNRALPLVRLADALELDARGRAAEPAGGAPVVVLGSGDHRVAFAADAVLDEQEMLVKPLRKPLSRVRNVSSGTILGTSISRPMISTWASRPAARYC